MKVTRKIKLIAGRNALRREKEPERIRKGSNFADATKVAFVYVDSDEDYFRNTRQFIKQIKTEFNVKHISALGFIDVLEKNIPVWQNQKLEFAFFTRVDLNWQLKPVKNVSTFVNEEFDILVDLSDGKNLPINFIVKESRAFMKVGVKGSKAERFYDLIIDMGPSYETSQFLDQIKRYLSNPKIR